jgi:DnaJ-class molecular chaperone with C-terminal Zn finger domain
MFKDYYLILGIGKEATPEEIEKAFKDAEAKLDGATSSKEFQDIKEAFAVLSHQETKILYDKELEAYNESGDFANYEIKDRSLANTINSLQTNIEVSEQTSSGCGTKIGKGCMWAVVIVIVLMLQMCITAIMKQKGRNAVRNRYSYVMPQKPANSNVYQLL